jgi:hypothetical protein
MRPCKQGDIRPHQEIASGSGGFHSIASPECCIQARISDPCAAIQLARSARQFLGRAEGCMIRVHLTDCAIPNRPRARFH